MAVSSFLSRYSYNLPNLLCANVLSFDKGLIKICSMLDRGFIPVAAFSFMSRYSHNPPNLLCANVLSFDKDLMKI